MARDAVSVQTLVVMDKNYGGIFKFVARTIYYVANEWNIGLCPYPLAYDHMDKQVFKFYATDEEMRIIQARIEDMYPGLCMFNPPMCV